MRLFLVPIFVYFAFSVTAGDDGDSTSNDDDARLTGPILKNSTQIPWIVHLTALNNLDNNVNTCGGTIVNHTIILTTAKCVYGSDRVEVRAGSIAPNNAEQTITGVAVWHKDYGKNSLRNDIAVVILKRGLNYTATVQPVKFPKKSEVGKDKHAGKSVTLYGWGYNASDSGDVPYLQMQDIIVAKNDACYKELRNIYYELPSTAFCGNTTGGVSICKHDLGGPVMYIDPKAKVPTPTVVGLISHSIGCPSLVPNMFTRLDPFFDWIQAQGGPKASK